MTLDPSHTDRTQQWVPLLTTASPAEAHLVRGLLEGEGIACWLRPRGVPQLPLTVNRLGEIDVCVDAADFDAGQRMIEDVRRPGSSEEQDGVALE